jgi:1-acyl-sn-glycerol-3-phosphate acyltransferase
LSVCIFPEGGVPDDESLLWIRLRMVHRLAIEHQIYSFADNKRDSLILFQRWPWINAKIHKQIETFKTGLDRHIREEVRDIYTQLVFENQSKRKPMFAK